MLSSSSTSTDNQLETGTDEPFLVTEGLKSAFSTPNGGQILEEATKRVSTTTLSPATLKTTMETEVPTMKMYAWEMQRGDIDVRGGTDMFNAHTADQNIYTPISKRRPPATEQPFGSNSLLMPQELPEDVDLPRTYEIGPRLVLPQDREEGSGSKSNEVAVDLPQSPPIAPPTLVSAERDRDELKKVVETELQRIRHPNSTPEVSLHTAPRRYPFNQFITSLR